MAVLIPVEGSEVIHVLEHESKATLTMHWTMAGAFENAYGTTDSGLMPESL